MDVAGFIRKAADLGFDTPAGLNLELACAAIDGWKSRLNDDGFLQRYRLCTNPREVLPGAEGLLVLAYPYRTYTGYPEGVGRVSGYYTASNRAFRASGALSEFLCSQGIRAVRSHRLPHKVLANAAGLGRYGRNGVIVRSGTHIVLSVIVADTLIKLPPVQVPVPDCGNCGACETACPTGCLKDGYVETDRCLRSYMTHNIDGIPDDMRPVMGGRLLGCDNCLNACPGLKHDPMPAQFRNLFAWDALTDAKRFAKNRAAIAKLIGSNYADTLHGFALTRFT